jgi:hypothetical protein
LKIFDFFRVKGDGELVKGLSEYDLFQIFIKMEHGLDGLNGFKLISLFASENGLKRISWLVDNNLSEFSYFFEVPITHYHFPMLSFHLMLSNC